MPWTMLNVKLHKIIIITEFEKKRIGSEEKHVLKRIRGH